MTFEQNTDRLNTVAQETLETVEILCRRYQISALSDFIQSCRNFAQEEVLNIAILGRFKTGKSSFLNCLIGRSLLPVGVIPVTATVIELEYNREERAEIRFLDGHTEIVPVVAIDRFVAEEKNPGNAKQVAIVRVGTPAMAAYRGIRFVDTPGLESVFEHNTAASMDWLPNVGLALVGVSADVPLSQHDIQFIRNVARYTPNISILLTKVDIFESAQRAQVEQFVDEQIQRNLGRSLAIFPYSTKPGFNDLRSKLDHELLARARIGVDEQRKAILAHKLATLVKECRQYLEVALRSSEAEDTQKILLRSKVLGEQQSLDDTRTALKLIVRHEAAGTRSSFETVLKKEERPLALSLRAEMQREFPRWNRSLAKATDAFDDWLRHSIAAEMTKLSQKHHCRFVEPVGHVSRQLSQSLQDFRNRLSERTLNALGVPLRTTEIDLQPENPRSPDIRVGKIFDRNWELLSFIVPMRIVKTTLQKHFERKIDDVVFTNLSRLASQWEELINKALVVIQDESLRRLDSLIATVEKLLEMAGPQAPRIRMDIQNLDKLLSILVATKSI